ncbi:cytochrome c3 family protein [Ferrimonas balearica]|uniref:cytochrome c3 family protein n=1 Tax=Ferrimonas balearica TaxID=44012 RepID=UPI001C99F354|nr:cytochrome c3 family protein [Ferrimonas balearica]MBY5923271.1 cytochrome c3 family protein [Ferrimonas balearica]MBY5995229.1 cytochrome c3 family protein [Ferrimonas balearica]
MKQLLISLGLALALTSGVQAGELVAMKGKLEGRSNHAFLYEDGCNGCHTGNAKKYVDDTACVECHGTIDTIEITTELVLEEANPHTSIHYGNGASCLACHAEHETKAPVCSECHRTWFNER